MFDSNTNITDRLTNAVDLLMDFATLGEYGLEPVGRTRQGCVDRPSATAARRPSTARATRATTRGAHCSLAEESGLFRTRRTRPGQLA